MKKPEKLHCKNTIDQLKVFSLQNWNYFFTFFITEFLNEKNYIKKNTLKKYKKYSIFKSTLFMKFCVIEN